MTNATRAVVTATIIIAITAASCRGLRSSSRYSESSWQEEFELSACTLVPTGRNEYFVLAPGFQMVLEGKSRTGRDLKLAITVLDETREVDGVTTRVVEEREWRDSEVIEVSRNFFAICEETKDIFYFGEEVDDYQNGQLVGHSGAWLAGENGARAGLIMPGEPSVGIKYYQELAPGVAMDRAEVVDLDHKFETPAGTFRNCLTTKEGTALNPQEEEFKTYAPEIGLVQDEALRLTRYGFVELESS